MKERPIIFSGPMVQAILDGRKTMTRRVIRFKHPTWGLVVASSGPSSFVGRTERLWVFDHKHEQGIITETLSCPYGVPGDRLWVRETWAQSDEHGLIYRANGEAGGAAYRGVDMPGGWTFYGKWRSPIFMPRWASRITLEITAVRVERVQDISADDVQAEGFAFQHAPEGTLDGIPAHENAFANYWDSLNAKRGYGWGANPWTWVIEFKRVERSLP